ncbi:MAG: helix-hairpin-helix domain-containing protein [Cocleimonas sp.]|nr:helix-hairpin-helix domain-containing protein [Cocleimonas sp.]
MKYKSLLLATLLSIFSVSAFAETVNINKADASAFQYYLKGIGVKKAIKIINYRQANKEFQSIAEIMEVKGIGRGIFTNIKADLSLIEGEISAPNKKTHTKKEKIIKVDIKKEEKLKEIEKSVEVVQEVSKTDSQEKLESEASSRKEEGLNSNKKVNPEIKVELKKLTTPS